MLNSPIHWIDGLIVILSILFTVGTGLYFSKRQKSSDRYFIGSKNFPSWAIGLSIFATLLSSVTFLAYPAAAYRSNWILLVQGLMVPVVLVGIIWIIVPLFRRVVRLSTYEYFERRFGFFARLYSSIAFMLTHFSKMGTVLYLICLAMSSFFHLHILAIMFILWFAIVALTLLGGMEAVIWMDVIQGSLLIGGGLLCLGILLFRNAGGPTEALSQALHMGKIGVGPFTFSLQKLTFWVMVFNGAFYALQKYGTDQTIVQRYLTAKSDKDAKHAAYIGVFASVSVWTLFMLIGSLLYVFYHTGTATLPQGITADKVFPYFISTQLPVGAVGLVLAALVAAALASLQSDLNCLSAIGIGDYYQRFKPNSTDKQKLRMGRLLVFIASLLMMLVTYLYITWNGQGVLGVVFGLYSIFSAGIVGIFLLGILSRRANRQGLYIGIAVCVLFTAYAVLTSTQIHDKLILNLGKYNFHQHKYMLGVYSHLIVLFVGYAASFLFKSQPAEDDLTIYGYFKKKAA
ncbi:sodium:solute symporter family transporter [Microbacter margulisiae]|uniref:SSS family solute:Na+ symporter n=1 Tax=Microbacter margulisiae TaxID=1350067 RepID=A0A7W5H1V4_9PORP|nr:sodium/solute symporter [Microbacter margulisiae]MBB3186994.1 SSS family solute:Na+ symporter [Microbacter margulisiae]